MKCSRLDCEQEGEKRHAVTSRYCRRCYRVLKILDYCHRKYPQRSTTWNEVAALWQEAERSGACPHCLNPMALYSEDGKRRGLATIQHYDDGRLGVICFTCNLAHSKSELGDALFNVPAGYKFCPDCKATKLKSEFYRTSRDLNGYITYCKPCQDARKRKIRRKNRSIYANLHQS